MKIKANQALFDEINEIASKLERSAALLKGLNGIVQNDMEVSETELLEFKKVMKENRAKIVERANVASESTKQWWLKVVAHIEECNKEEAKNA